MKSISALILIYIFLPACEMPGTTAQRELAKAKALASDTSSESAKEAGLVDVPGWEYFDKDDPMSSSKVYFAQVNAVEPLQFGFPYSGGAIATLTVRRKEKSNDVIVSISKGQFFNSYNEGKRIRVRFDDAKAQRYSYNEPADNSSEYIFIDNEKDFIAKLKKANRLIVQAQFYQEGLREMVFNVKDFQWKH